MAAKIKALARYRKKGGPEEPLQQARLLAGLGMESNFHQGGDRQLCLLTAEIRDWMSLQTQEGICFARLKENILIEGMPSTSLLPGVKICMGEAVLQISEARKRCHTGCSLRAQGMQCRLPESAVFAVVLQGGIVRAGDSVSIL